MDANISAKEFEKLSKYKDLQIEQERMWQLKTSIIPSCWCSRISEKGTAKQLEKIIAKQKLADTKNSTYEYCTRIKKNVINKSYSKKNSAK